MSITGNDLSDLNHIDDAMLAIRRKLLIIDALIKQASTNAEGLAAVERRKKDEHHVTVLVYELEQRISDVLAFADAADAKFIGVAA